jgi:hypothetical protein
LSPVFYTIQCCLVPFVYLYNILPRAQVRKRASRFIDSGAGSVAKWSCYSQYMFL